MWTSVKELNEVHSINTLACCCGHRKGIHGYIVIHDDFRMDLAADSGYDIGNYVAWMLMKEFCHSDVKKMLDLGYELKIPYSYFTYKIDKSKNNHNIQSEVEMHKRMQKVA
jgi:hypothetical protein